MFDKVYLIKSISAVTNYNSSSCLISIDFNTFICLNNSEHMYVLKCQSNKHHFSSNDKYKNFKVDNFGLWIGTCLQWHLRFNVVHIFTSLLPKGKENRRSTLTLTVHGGLIQPTLSSDSYFSLKMGLGVFMI